MATGPVGRNGSRRPAEVDGESTTMKGPTVDMPIKILLVEDNPAEARLLRELFTEMAPGTIEMVHVASMTEAEIHVADHSPDLIVLDLGLPDAHGLEAVQRAHAAAPHIPLVVLTGLDSESLAVKALQEGAHDYLVKGQIEPRGLLRALHLAVEREANQRELIRQRHELERSNADLEEFAYAASHDLKAPLRAIAHLVQWIDEDVRPTASPDTIENLKLLDGRVARLQMLLDGMLAYARVGRTGAELELVDIVEVVDTVVSMLELPVGFTVACEGAMFAIDSYRIPIQMIFRNLLTNALQHHDRAEGHVAVSMRLVDERTVEFRVSDDGPGIPARFHERIFVIFQTLQSREDTTSTGLGLAMVKKQVTENGGRIWIEGGALDRGTTFVFTWKIAGREGGGVSVET
jgi:signal transduction histidine kinase